MKRIFYGLVKVIVAIGLLLGGMMSCTEYLTWSAERKAKEFCDSIAVGSDISLAITRFDKETGYEKKADGNESAFHYGFPDDKYAGNSHTFMFPALMFDRAYCDTELTSDGKVIARKSYFLYD